MDSPIALLLQAAARLNAEGHIALALDLQRLARRWSPPEELVGNPIDLPAND